MSRSDSKSKLIEATATLLKQQGYHGTGLNQIVAQSGAPKGSLYFHFPGGKEELAAAALQRSGEQMREALGAFLATARVPADALVSVIGWLEHQLQESSFRAGCPLATVVLEAAHTHPTLQAVCSDSYHAWQTSIASYLQRAGVEVEAALDYAIYALAAIEGALLLSRAHHSVEPLRTVARHLHAQAMSLPTRSCS